MPLQFNQFVRALMAGGGGFSQLTSLRTALLGDSISSYAVAALGLTGSVTRDSSGNIPVLLTNHACLTGDLVQLSNVPGDDSFCQPGIATVTDANNLSIATGIAGAPGTQAMGATGALLNLTNISGRGSFHHLQSYYNNMQLVGCYSRTGGSASAFGPLMAQAVLSSADIILINCGVNDLQGGGTDTSIANSVNALIDQCIAAGKFALVYPVQAGTSHTAQQNTYRHGANVLIAAHCLANPNQSIFVDAESLMVDGSGVAIPSMSFDGLHWSYNGAYTSSLAAYSAIGTKFKAVETVARSSSDSIPVNGMSKFMNRGPWNTTAGGTFNAGYSGTSPTGSFYYSTGNGITGVCSLVDPGDGKGVWAQCVATPIVAAAKHYFAWPYSTAIASLGLAVGDTIQVSAEIEWSGATASTLGALGLNVKCVNGAFATVAMATSGAAATDSGKFPDAATRVIVTAPITIKAGTVNLTAQVEAKFGSVSASPATIKVRGFTFLKL